MPVQVKITYYISLSLNTLRNMNKVEKHFFVI